MVGGQFGSEAKGHVTDILATELPADGYVNVRVGGPNAGHTAVNAEGEKIALRTIPIGVVNSKMPLFIGPGSEIDIQVLQDELDVVGHRLSDDRPLLIDPEATLLEPQHRMAEAQLTGRIGSTAKGIGAARSDRLWRTARRVCDVAGLISELHPHVIVGRPNRQTQAALIEGTQGYGLGLHAGHYPYCTAGDCRDVDFLAQSGWALRPFQTWVVFRTLPIRVAGNSGYLYDETDWATLATESGGYIQAERTTVTKKVRRIGRWDPLLAEQAMRANAVGATPVLTFVDYLDPDLSGSRSWHRLVGSPAWPTIQKMEADVGAPFGLFTTGPDAHIWRHG